MAATPATSTPLPSGLVTFLKGFVVFATLMAFASMFGVGIYRTWTTTANNPPVFNEPFLYIATTVAALIGGVVAVGFGQKPPVPPQGPSIDTPSPLATWQHGQLGPNLLILASLNITSLTRLLLWAADPALWSKILASMYAIVYFFWGLASVLTWVVHPSEAPNLVKNLATTFLGLAIPVAAGFFGSQTHNLVKNLATTFLGLAIPVAAGFFGSQTHK